MPPSIEELERRLTSRGTDSSEKIKMRVAKAKEEIDLAGHFDRIIINDNLEDAYKESYDLINKFLIS
jgi:guanylate kinase